ncbi:hypothetical protein HJC23_002291 [Cyclotella cryptica]|uniref:Uncharacterized protein n=1 Tax=Cyclotella cryptica TaxID=29204 RepID=A0ABD3QFI3_9STRA|eukprot:CCRYP_005765-RA/>CCRYP_005765-RA protein AED:0.15 eAED:0.15 QI:499/1/1/1/0.5/0.33/3/267/159
MKRRRPTNISQKAFLASALFSACSVHDIAAELTDAFGAGLSNSNGCRIIIEKNEWAVGCIPAVNFVVKLVDCGDGVAMSDVTVRFIDENNKELGRDYFVAPLGQCTVTGYGNIKTITPRGGNNVYMVASCDLCGRAGTNGVNSLTSAQMAINGQVTDCF